MSTIFLRSVKGTPLSNAEVDANFTNLNADKIEVSDTTSANTPNKIVRRDANGNFSAGTISANFDGDLVGIPKAPTAASGTNTTQVATTAFVIGERSTVARLTNKTIDLSENPVVGTLAQFNTACTDADFVSLTGTETLINKTLTDPKISRIDNGGFLTLPTGVDTLIGRNSSDTLANKSIGLGNNTLTGTLAQFNTACSDADFVSLTGTETLTNKTINVNNNTIKGIAANSFVLSNASGQIDGVVAQKVVPTGAVVGTSDTQTLTNKTIQTGTFTSGYTEQVFTVTGTAPALTATNGSIQTWTLTANSNPTAVIDNGQSILLGITAGSYTISSWPSVTWSKVGGGGVAPTLTSTGVNWIVLWKVGGVLCGAFLGTA